jgi:hypothetical protein
MDALERSIAPLSGSPAPNNGSPAPAFKTLSLDVSHSNHQSVTATDSLDLQHMILTKPDAHVHSDFAHAHAVTARCETKRNFLKKRGGKKKKKKKK